MLHNITKADIIAEFEEGVIHLSEYFVNKYFDKDPEMWWVADEVGGVLFVNDQFLSLEDMVQYIRARYTKPEFWAHRDYLSEMQYIPEFNIRNWKKLRKK
jgi:hypothetical protein